MFNIGAGEWAVLIVLGIILVGPDRLPHVASEAARYIRKFKELTSSATQELRENLGPGFEELNVTDLHPKRLIAKTLNDVTETLPVAEMKEISKLAQIEDSAHPAKIDPDLL